MQHVKQLQINLEAQTTEASAEEEDLMCGGGNGGFGCTPKKKKNLFGWKHEHLSVKGHERNPRREPRLG